MNPRSGKFLAVGGLIVAGLVLAWSLARRASAPQPDPQGRGFDRLLAAWQEQTQGEFSRLPAERRPPHFPADHGAHEATPAEQWELWAHLAAGADRFAVHFRIERLGASPEAPQRPSRWAAHQFYRSQLAVAEPGVRRFRPFERYGRAALGLSGHAAGAHRVWVDGNALHWEATDDARPTFQVTLREAAFRADLRLAAAKPVVIPEGGLFAGDGWRGYWFSRFEASGTVQSDGRALAVKGGAWLTHFWGALPPLGGQVALNRWLIQLWDGRELALLQLRRRDGSGAPLTQGVLITREGGARGLAAGELRLEPLRSRGRYPLAWRVNLPGQNLDLRISPRLDDQEIRAPVPSWSGWVAVEEPAPGKPPGAGEGFMELTGY